MGERLLKRLVREALLAEASRVSSTVILRRAIGMAVAAAADPPLTFIPPRAGPSGGRRGGIRLNPAEGNLPDASAMRAAIEKAGLTPGNEIQPGAEDARSGKFVTFPLAIPPGWFTESPGKELVDAAIDALPDDDDRKKALHADIVRRAEGGTLLSDTNIVLRSKALESRLFTGQGLGELAEYAVAGAISGSSQFDQAIQTAILAPSWQKADDATRDRFRTAYDSMEKLAVERMSSAAEVSQPRELFGDDASVEGAGGGRYDVKTNNARIHVKYDIGGSMTRLAGIKPEYRGKKSKAGSIEDKLANISFGGSTIYWKHMREQFKDNFGLDINLPKDKAILKDAKFYEWMIGHMAFDPRGLEGGDITTDAEYTREQLDWLNAKRPNFKRLLLDDIKSEFIDDPRALDDAGNLINYFYFTFYPNRDGTLKDLKIEQLGISADTELPKFNIIMNPTYLDGTQIGRPYILVDEVDNVFLELEFRARGTSKPIQIHRGKDFMSAIGSEETSFSRRLAELRQVIRNIIREQARESGTTSAESSGFQPAQDSPRAVALRLLEEHGLEPAMNIAARDGDFAVLKILVDFGPHAPSQTTFFPFGRM